MGHGMRVRSSRGSGSRAGLDLDLVETAAPAGDGGNLGTVLHVKLLEDVVHVVLDGRDLDLERLRDLLVREPSAEQRSDLALAARQRGSVRGVPLACE